jgi:hypothetical protein
MNGKTSSAQADFDWAGKFVQALWNSPTPEGIDRYYEGFL